MARICKRSLTFEQEVLVIRNWESRLSQSQNRSLGKIDSGQWQRCHFDMSLFCKDTSANLVTTIECNPAQQNFTERRQWRRAKTFVRCNELHDLKLLNWPRE
jgi:hypothetical protein